MIKKSKLLMVLLVLVVGVCVGGAGVPNATAAIVDDYSGAWYATDGNQNYLSFDISGAGQTFYLLNASGDELPVLTESGLATVNMIKENNEWSAVLGDQELDLGATGYFWYKLGEQTEYSYEEGIAGSIYTLKFDDLYEVIAFDVAPVPIPSAALLLASGILGLGWLKRRSA